jgi:hypothetical protein
MFVWVNLEITSTCISFQEIPWVVEYIMANMDLSTPQYLARTKRFNEYKLYMEWMDSLPHSIFMAVSRGLKLLYHTLTIVNNPHSSWHKQ